MFEWLQTLEFARLSALTVFAAAPLLLIPYLRQNPGKRIIVSSTLLLARLPKHTFVKKRVQLPLRFFLELLALLLLALAAGAPFLGETREHIAIVLDNSLSMAARENPSRFEKAKLVLTEFIKEEKGENTFSLFTSSPEITLQGEKSISNTQVLAELKKLNTTEVSDSLSFGVLKLARSEEFDRIHVITDNLIELLPPETDFSSQSKTIIETTQVGSPVINPYIASLRIERSGRKQTPTGLLTEVGLSGNAAASVNLTLFGNFIAEGLPKEENILLEQRTLQLSPEKLTQARFRLSGSMRKLNIFHVALSQAPEEKEILIGETTKNALLADDKASVTQESTGSEKILLISPSPQKGALGLERLPGAALQRVSPSQFEKLTQSKKSGEKNLANYKLLIFHQTAPTIVPKVPAFLILPPKNNSLFEVRNEVKEPNITSWAGDNPITTYLRIPILKPKAALTFEVPPFAEAVINTEPGSIFVAGESKGIRFAASGIELLPFEGAKTPAPSILLLNTVHWLTGEKQPSSTTLLAPNAFYPEESETFRQNQIELPASLKKKDIQKKSIRSFWWELAFVTFLVLLAESILFFQEAPSPS